VRSTRRLGAGPEIDVDARSSAASRLDRCCGAGWPRTIARWPRTIVGGTIPLES